MPRTGKGRKKDENCEANHWVSACPVAAAGADRLRRWYGYPKSGGSKRQYDDSIPAELEGDKYNLHNDSLETADGIYYDANGERRGDAADGVAHTKNYRNDVTVSCKLASGYTVTLGMDDASVGTGAIYLNPTTDNPKGTTYLWSKYNHKTNSSMTGRVEFDYEAERKTTETTYAEIVDEGVQNIFERYENDNTGNEGMVGLDMSYKGTYKYGAAWTHNFFYSEELSLKRGFDAYRNDEFILELYENGTHKEMGIIRVSILYDGTNDQYYLAGVSELVDSSADQAAS